MIIIIFLSFLIISRKLLSQTPFFSLNYTTKFKWNFLKKGSTGISKNLHARSRHSLLSEFEILGFFVFKTYRVSDETWQMVNSFECLLPNTLLNIKDFLQFIALKIFFDQIYFTLKSIYYNMTSKIPCVIFLFLSVWYQWISQIMEEDI